MITNKYDDFCEDFKLTFLQYYFPLFMFIFIKSKLNFLSALEFRETANLLSSPEVKVTNN